MHSDAYQEGTPGGAQEHDPKQCRGGPNDSVMPDGTMVRRWRMVVKRRSRSPVDPTAASLLQYASGGALLTPHACCPHTQCDLLRLSIESL